MPRNLLHLCSYYTGQKLYSNLITKLDGMGISQQVYIPVRASSEIGKNAIHDKKNITLHYDLILKPRHRLLYKLKIKKTYQSIAKKIKLNEVNFVHAHSLFSDGGIALKINEDYGVPYIVAVRTTDINVFLRFMPHLRSLALRILSNAASIVFINPSLKKKLFDLYIPDNLVEEFDEKSHCVPNGVDEYWINNKGEVKKKSGEPLKLLYVGTFIKRKSLPEVIEAVRLLQEKNEVVLKIIGGGGHNGQGKGDRTVLTAINNAIRDGLRIELIGRLAKHELKLHYKESDVFVMPSRHETFGIVYLEAMSQGTPIVYTKNDGIDGYFYDGEVGKGTESLSPTNIAECIHEVLDNYEYMSSNSINVISKYSWSTIGKTYMALYRF